MSPYFPLLFQAIAPPWVVGVVKFQVFEEGLDQVVAIHKLNTAASSPAKRVTRIKLHSVGCTLVRRV